MAYVENSLLEDEFIISKAAVSWLVFTKSFIILTTTIIAFIYTYQYILQVSSSYLLLIYIHDALYFSCIMWAICEFTCSLIRKTTTEIVITNKRVITKLGWIARNTIEIQIFRVEACQIKQSVLARILKYGTIVISGAGHSTHTIDYVHRPTLFRKQLMEVLEITYRFE